MSEAPVSHEPADELKGSDRMTALFAQMVIQQANMAMMLMGQAPHPETGQVVKDMEAARFFIDQLEMLEAKTKGNLSKEEEDLLKQSLMSLRLNFVQAVEAESPRSEAKPEASKPANAGGTPVTGEGAATEEEHRKKFSKKY